MSWNEVRIDENGIALFEDEKSFFEAQKVAFQYENGGGYPGSGQALSSPSGRIILTNIRIIYIPDKTNSILSSFSAPLENVLDGKATTSWISGGSYKATVKSVPGHRFSNEYGRLSLNFSSNPIEFMNAFSHLRSKLGDAPIPYQESLPNYDRLMAVEQPPTYFNGEASK